jgi:hypothetical protein
LKKKINLLLAWLRKNSISRVFHALSRQISSPFVALNSSARNQSFYAFFNLRFAGEILEILSQPDSNFVAAFPTWNQLPLWSVGCARVARRMRLECVSNQRSATTFFKIKPKNFNLDEFDFSLVLNVQ